MKVTSVVSFVLVIIVAGTAAAVAQAEDNSAAVKELAAALAKLDANVLPKGELREMLPKDVDRRLDEANQKSSAEWRAIKTKEDWERFRDEKIGKLRASLNVPAEKVPLNLQVTGEIAEDGYIIRKILFNSRPKWQVTANLYLPAKIPEKMPGIILSHSHHSPKSQGELQDMGALYARAGCAVLVPDHLGHGERRQHPFVSAESFPEKYQVGRQDYHFRYNTSIQLYACGESLMGWMAWDLIRGVDVLESLPNIDRERIALMGGVAGGGDPCGVTGALEKRITLLVPMNFGGPQPETRYPLPENAEETFDYAGGGSWESTRNLHRSAADGFLPWVIVGSIAPRGLIHGHEFTWDRERDPVWKRYEKIYDFYGANDKLDYTNGYGSVKLSESEASHCGNIGKHHRQRINAYLAKHWNVKADESQPIKRHTAAELACVKEGMQLTPLREVLRDLPEKKTTWKDVLGNVAPYPVKAERIGREELHGVTIERYLLSGERDIRVPVLLLTPSRLKKIKAVEITITQEGKGEVLKQEASKLAQGLLSADEESAVCLVDVRGTGETCPDTDRGRRGYATSLAASYLMLNDPLVAGQVRDLRSVFGWLRTKHEGANFTVRGSLAAKPNVEKPELIGRPLELDQRRMADPMGAHVVLLASQFEEQRLSSPFGSGHVVGGLTGFGSLLDSPFVLVPLDAIVPGAIPAGDIEAAAAYAKQSQGIISDMTVTGLNTQPPAK